MRKVLAFLVWLFSFWTWKDFFVRWLGRPPFYPASGETAVSEPFPSQEGHSESALARFLSSLPEDERWCRYLSIDGDSRVQVRFGPHGKSYSLDMQAGYREFLGAVASSEVVFRERLVVYLSGDGSLKHMEAFADALRQSGNAFRKVDLTGYSVSAIPFAECLSSALLGNDAIQHLDLDINNLNETMGEELAAEFMAIVAVPHILPILKSFHIYDRDWDGEGMEHLMKPFNSPDSVLEELEIGSPISDAELKHISGLLVASTSLKTLDISPYSRGKKNEWMRGYISIASALCSNRSLQVLHCGICTSMDLKALLDPLMPKTNNLQPNTTLTRLDLHGAIGGKEGIETLANMFRTNMSLLEVSLWDLDEFSSKDVEGIENVLAILEALKPNKTLKTIGFPGCSAVGGHKVLGAMMDLLLENHCIEDIDLWDTPLEDSGDAEYIYVALSKRKNMKLWDIVQGMTNVKPTSGRVFLCGQPFASTLCISKFSI